MLAVSLGSPWRLALALALAAALVQGSSPAQARGKEDLRRSTKPTRTLDEKDARKESTSRSKRRSVDERSRPSVDRSRRREDPTRAGSGATPAQECHTFPAAEPGQPPRTVCGDLPDWIRITSARAVPDVASGERRVRLEVEVANGPVTQWRAVEGGDFTGVAWRPWPSAGAPVFPVTCGGRVHLQVRGADIPNPNRAGSTIPNATNPVELTYTLPESLGTRIASFGPETRGILIPEDPERGFDGPTTTAASWRVELANYPGELDPRQVAGVQGNCFEFLGTPEQHGLTQFSLPGDAFWAIGRVDPERTSCTPQLIVPECSSWRPRRTAHAPAQVGNRWILAAPEPLRFEPLRTVTVEDTASLWAMFGLDVYPDTNCEDELVEVDGDLAFRTASDGQPKGCRGYVRWESTRLPPRGGGRIFWRSEASGGCGLGRPYLETVAASVVSTYVDLQCELKGLCLDRPASGRSGTQPRYLEPELLGRGLSVERDTEIQHACGLDAGSVRTFIDRVEFRVPADVDFP